MLVAYRHRSTKIIRGSRRRNQPRLTFPFQVRVLYSRLTLSRGRCTERMIGLLHCRESRLHRFSLLVLVVANMHATAAMADSECETFSTESLAPVPTEAIDRETLNQLIAWIALNTMYDVSLTYRSPPAITFCEIGEHVPYEETELLVDEMLGAVYDQQRRTIHLVQPWSSHDLHDLSTLLHELIHDVQLENREWSCTGEPELEAYWLQNKWLVERGEHLDIPWSAILELSTCPEGDAE